MSNGAPPPPDYKGAAQQTAQAGADMNRLNTSNSYGASQTYNADGSVSQQWTGPMGDLNNSLMGQAQQAMSRPFDLSGLPQVGTGQEAMDAAYKAQTARLDPMWQQRESAEHTRLLNQGLDPSSAAYREAMNQLGQQRNDAYGQAYGQSVGQGMAMRDQDSRMRQQALGEYLTGRQQPMQDLLQMQGLMGQPGYNQVAGPNLLAAAGMQDSADWQRYMHGENQMAQRLGAGAGLVGSLAQTLAPFFLCDERAKEDVVRLPAEVLPGVPLATWRYRGQAQRYAGVIAQDLQRVAPEYVRERGDGMLTVHPMFAPEAL